MFEDDAECKVQRVFDQGHQYDQSPQAARFYEYDTSSPY